jgi:nucleotide-binding universal stress UspA family protein
VSSGAFADGRAEAVEFRITPDSPLRGKQLKELGSAAWLVVAILRNGRLIIPHGGSTLESGDRVTVVGAAADYSSIVATFTAGEAKFPLDYGRVVVMAVKDRAEAEEIVVEAARLVRSSFAERLLVVHPQEERVSASFVAAHLTEFAPWFTDDIDVDAQAVAGDPSVAAFPVAADNEGGVIVVAGPGGGPIESRRALVGPIRAARAAGLPVLFARGSDPYAHIVVSAFDSPAADAAARAAIDLAAVGGIPLIAAAVTPPAFTTGTDAGERVGETAARIREEAAVQGVTVVRRVREGNPVRVLEAIVAGVGLLVLGMPTRTPSLLVPGTAGHLVRRSRTSVMLVPEPARR